MRKKVIWWVLFIAWTSAAIYVGTTMARNWNRNIEYSGSRVEFEASTDRYIDLSQEVTLTAASSDFFVFRKETGETVVGTPADPPLGWSSNTYFVVGPVQISEGRWIVESDSPTVHLVSETPMRVVTPETPWNKSANDAVAFFLSFLVWFVGVVVSLPIPDD